MGKSQKQRSTAQKAKKEEKQKASSQDGKEQQKQVMMVVGALVVLYGIVYQMSTESGPVKLTSDDQVKGVFMSGQPWLVWCKDVHSGAAQSLSKQSTDEMIKEASQHLSGHGDKKAKVGIMNCKDMLPGGRTTVEKVGLNTTVHPVLFVAANGNTPVQVPVKFASPASVLAKWVGERVQPMSYLPKDTPQLQKNCLDFKWCAAIMSRGELLGAPLKKFSELKQKYRNVRFMKIDQKKLKLTLGYSNLLKKNSPTAAEPTMVLIHKYKKKKDSTPVWHITAHKGDLDPDGNCGNVIDTALYTSKDNTVVPLDMEKIEGSIKLAYKKGKAPKKKAPKKMTPEERRKAYEKKKAAKSKMTPEQRKAMKIKQDALRATREAKRREEMAKEEGQEFMQAAEEGEEGEEDEMMGEAGEGDDDEAEVEEDTNVEEVMMEDDD